MTGTIGVAISTTGDEHRIGFLETCVEAWRKVLPLGSTLVVTVDGDEAAAQRVYRAIDPTKFGNVIRVGHSRFGCGPYDGRLGVAVNKNTGLEYLMDAHVEHAFLCDDDTWPLSYDALDLHIGLGQPHSMVCWGAHRMRLADMKDGGMAEWTWPRGVLLYVQPQVLAVVGGMDERFGPGGHEHAEWSRRIHQAGLTPAMFISPSQYAATGTSRGAATGSSAYWHAEDMPRLAESHSEFTRRKRTLTSVRRTDADWPAINRIMAERDGDTSYVPFRAHDNGRASATLCTTT